MNVALTTLRSADLPLGAAAGRQAMGTTTGDEAVLAPGSGPIVPIAIRPHIISNPPWLITAA